MSLRACMILAFALPLFIGTTEVLAQCNPGNGVGGTGADVIVGELEGSIQNYGNAGGYYAYSVGTTSCNIGTAELQWIAGNNQHPVIGQNLYRLANGRFEQIAQSWLKHGFTALQQNACSCGCVSSGTGARLGIGCSDPYSSSLNGSQGSLGAKSEVTDPANGAFIYPQILDPPNTDLTWRRLRARAQDMDPALNVGALYFVEGHYVTPDDATANNQDNNASYRRVAVGASATNFPLSYVGATQRQKQGIRAWQDTDPSVTLQEIHTPDNGLMILGYNVTDNGNGTFHYEYALYNMNSTRGAQSFSLPIPGGVTVTNVGFHDVEYHSGEPYSGADWTATVAPGSITWSTETFAANANANALRWATLYNFRFDANAMPAAASATVAFFLPGTPSNVLVPAVVPSGDFTLAVTNLACTTLGQNIGLSWVNSEVYDSIEVRREGTLIATLSGSATSTMDLAPGTGLHFYSVLGIAGGIPSGAVSCSAEILPPLALSLPLGLPDIIDPLGDTLTVQITEQNGGMLLSGSATLFWDSGTGFAPIPLVSQGAGSFTGTLPATPCGSQVAVYFQAQSTTNETFSEPAAGAAAAYILTSASSQDLELDECETNQGWTVGSPSDNATSGLWELGDPNPTGAQPGEDHTPAGFNCWFTGQSNVGAGNGVNDVDGGTTTLTSPLFDLTSYDQVELGYWRWFSNNLGSAPFTDTLRVEVTDNGVDWIVVEEVGPSGPGTMGGWVRSSFSVGSLVSLTANVQLRFIVGDIDNGSIVEAAIDDVEIVGATCVADCNANGVLDSQDLLAGTSLDCNANQIPDECDIAAGTSLDANTNGTPDECENSDFVRGDCNGDGNRDLSDVVAGLGVLFNGKAAPGCVDSCDVNDDGSFNIADALYALGALFGQGPQPTAPSPSCGADPTADPLDCAGYAPCP
ncbi:MAG: hypothetical protein AB7O52_12655 [Planctomycetota bacterium]